MRDDHNDPLADLNASPLNPLPGAVWLLLLAVLGIEAVLWAGGAGLIGGPQAVGWRIEAIQRLGFSGAIQDWMLENRVFPATHLLRYASYSFIHAAPMHALFAGVLIAALGKTLSEAFGAIRFLVLALVTPMLGAVSFGLVVGSETQGWLFGAMPLAFALVGGFTWLKWHQAQGDRTLQRRAFAMIGILLVARLAFGLLAETGPGWVAEFASFGFAFVLSAGFLGPGSWHRLRERLRGRAG